MSDEKRSPLPVQGSEASNLIEAARARGGGYFQSAVVTILTLVVGALLTQTLIDAPRLRAENFAAEVHNFNQLQDNARSEFAAAADDQRDAMANLIHAMVDGDTPRAVRERAELVKTKFEAYQRAGARLQGLQQNYGPVFSADGRTEPVRDLGTQLLGLHYFEQGAMAAAGRFKVCLLALAEEYQRNVYSSADNQREVWCQSGEKKTAVTFLLYNQDGLSQTAADVEENGEFGRLDDCEAAIEKKLNFIAASLSSEVEGPGGLDTYLSSGVTWIRSMLGQRPPSRVGVAPPKLTLKVGCGTDTASENHLALMPAPENLAVLKEAHFHPRPGAGAAMLAADPGTAGASVQTADFRP